MFRGGGEIAQLKVAWRRATLAESFTSGCILFTTVMIFNVMAAALVGVEVDFRKAFLAACGFGIGAAASSLIFKSRMIVLR
ncbi:MAG: hypothetical protein K2X73_02820 [Sphingomonas sp.]|uniref:hypothetical protein n=1 Tax=Sphingomonas sp. TaxID=28214 RepID=UPI0025D318F1|nr:hypothetical protein [Sphingomonas sp.]MBX9880885.1 hypothetical protein [Sphingomonas sp.]